MAQSRTSITISSLIVAALALYGHAVDSPPRHPHGITSLEEYR